MEWGTLLEYLGTGGGLMVILNWVVKIPVLRKKIKLDKDDVSRHMAEKDNQTILQLYDNVRTLQEQVSRLEAALSKLVICPMWNNCPARLLVQDYKRKYFYPPKGQPRVERKGQHIPRDNPVEPGESDDTDGQPP